MWDSKSFLPRRNLRWVAVWLAGAIAAAMLGLYASLNVAPTWEVHVMRALQGSQVPGLQDVSLALKAAGNEPIAILLPGAIIGLVWAGGHVRLAWLLVLAALARPLSAVFKAIVDRPRPSDLLVDVSEQLQSPSFPSGHVLGTALFFGFLCYACTYLFPRGPLRWGFQAASVLVILLMGIGRMRLGEHWPTDVLGGYLIAALVVGILICLHRWRLGSAPAVATVRE